MLAHTASSVAGTGLLIVGEPHAVRETPSPLHRLASALGARAVAFEWSHEEMDDGMQCFLRDGPFDLDRQAETCRRAA